MFPTVFVSHGSPAMVLSDVAARDFLAGLGRAIGRPSAILVVSAHWETRAPTVGTALRPQTIHDFHGFPAPLYQLRYPAPGAPDLAHEVTGLLRAAGFEAAEDAARGLDHGAWAPLLLMYPEADIPVVPLSLQGGLGPAHHVDIGRALAPLRDRDVLVLGSGSFTHDLSRFRSGRDIDATAHPDTEAFAGWMDKALQEGRRADLLAYRRLAPFAVENHPTEEHLLPLFVALGAAGPEARGEHLHGSTTYGFLRMDTYAFR
ncbi:MAG TPA: class III extradiol ring-cleavage dioxygenase [Stellaceae bacterium]|nr:class III extradiol ring-cleavage dioxygenase [Stellaceae bacterium]